MLLVVGLEQHGHFEHRLLQQAALGAELVGADRLVLERQRGVEDADVVGGVAVARLGEAIFSQPASSATAEAEER